MQIWTAGLGSRASAKRAAKWGGWACLIAAAREAIGIIVVLSTAHKTVGQSIAWTIGAGIIPLIIATAGVRLLRGGGRLSGSLAVLVLALDLFLVIGPALSADIIGQIIAKVLLLLLALNGVRGAFALRHVDFTTELSDAFS